MTVSYLVKAVIFRTIGTCSGDVSLRELYSVRQSYITLYCRTLNVICAKNEANK